MLVRAGVWILRDLLSGENGLDEGSCYRVVRFLLERQLEFCLFNDFNVFDSACDECSEEEHVKAIPVGLRISINDCEELRVLPVCLALHRLLRCLDADFVDAYQ